MTSEHTRLHHNATRGLRFLGSVLYGLAFAAGCALIVYGLGVTPQ